MTGVSVPTRPWVPWAPPQIRWAQPQLPSLGQPLPNRPLPGLGLMTEEGTSPSFLPQPPAQLLSTGCGSSRKLSGPFLGVGELRHGVGWGAA